MNTLQINGSTFEAKFLCKLCDFAKIGYTSTQKDSDNFNIVQGKTTVIGDLPILVKYLLKTQANLNESALYPSKYSAQIDGYLHYVQQMLLPLLVKSAAKENLVYLLENVIHVNLENQLNQKRFIFTQEEVTIADLIMWIWLSEVTKKVQPYTSEVVRDWMEAVQNAME